MNKQVQVAGGVIAVLALVGLAWFLLQPSASTPTPERGRRVKVPVEKLQNKVNPKHKLPGAKTVAAPVPSSTESVLPDDHPFLKIPPYTLPDIPDSIKDPLGVLPITKEAMEMSVEEMNGDILECRDKFLSNTTRRVLSIDLHINSEVPPEDYGPPDAGEYGIIRGAKVMDTTEDLSDFEACITTAMEDILYDKPPGTGVRVNWKMDVR